MKLTTQEIILLTYLTNYDIKVIKDYSELYHSFDILLDELTKNYRINDKALITAREKTEISMEKLRYHDIKTVSIFEDNYPQKIKRFLDAPPLIYYKGTLPNQRSAAVVGSRSVSKYAKKITGEIVDWLNEYNICIVSGLALGIDTLAHQKAIENKQTTVAVLPNSLDSVYPNDNYFLANQILDQGGCLMSEMIFNINRGKKSFVQRNRIQAAMSEMVIPIEMGIKSGTMHTIDFAKRYRREIWLFKPTKLLSELENYAGINYLINTPSKNQYIFQDKREFDNIASKLSRETQLDINFNE